jgi:plasmid stability protein
MEAMTIRILDDLARSLKQVAAAQHKSIEQLAVERLQSLIDRPVSPRELLRKLRALPHPDPSAVEELEAAIAAARLPVSDEGVFDE